jgi:hypothetical protein
MIVVNQDVDTGGIMVAIMPQGGVSALGFLPRVG